MIGGGAGHIADMISRMKWNREQLQKRKKRMKSEDAGFIYYDSNMELRFREGSEKEKQIIRDKIRADTKRQHRLELSMLILSIILFIIAFGWFTRNFI
ncbi:MAG: hypothetical protein ACK5JD_16040 [Mangrovibacterium sp.]